MSPLMSAVSRVSALVPIYDFNTAKEYAERLLYTQLILCSFGALSWAFTGVLQVSFGFALAALVGFEVGSVKLLKMYAVSLVGMWFIDVIWLSLWAHRIDMGKDLVFYPSLADAQSLTQPLHNKYTTVPRFALAMECLVFLLRMVQILVWAKLWELDFGEVGGGGGSNDAYTNLGGGGGGSGGGPGGGGGGHNNSAMPAGGQQHNIGGGTGGGGMGGGGMGGGARGGVEPGEPRNGYRPFIVPEAGAPPQHSAGGGGSAAYVPPLSPPLGNKPRNNEYDYGEDAV
eukprot:CAMPEP_0197616240 /NCGR_PEP_ID=MMETSP1326-20131121/60432_1 /TAXON_ID=1155430 /ORGANISM="Genus nov. species nov., Strain RCC2288" /LENGTH=284 /DNA_ID=CAMNT_0043185127 /DNA_START=66 /DNA_END=920 /DNA_ORIENTATION=+